MWPLRIEHKPPSITTNRSNADVSTDYHISEEQPTAHERFISLPWRTLHHVMVWRIETECGSRESIGYQIYPKKLNGNECFRHACGGGQEDGDNFANVRGDEITNELLGVAVD